jgi:hypothetical protein
MELPAHSYLMRYYFFNKGKFTITSPSNLTIPVYPGLNYTITFNQLINPTTNYMPAVGFVDLNYMFQYNISQYVGIYSYPSTATGFVLRVAADDASGRLSRYSINYLAVSEDLKDFFIWINYQGFIINQ